eukprot:gene16338-61520_t
MLRYAFKGDGAAYPAAALAAGPKERAEGWAFTAAVLPRIHKCSASAAATIRANMEWGAATPGRLR